MSGPRTESARTDLAWLLLLAACVVLLHALTNRQYGFHRDELATLADARHLAWGFVAYPPVTPLIARLSLTLFGASLVGLRLFSSLAMGGATVLAGLMARELGGRRSAQLIAALAVVVSPVALIQGALFQYVSFDYLCWVLVIYFVLRLLNSEDPRWWLAIGAAIGAGMLNKYTMAFCALGVAGALILTPERRYLRSSWLWAGVALSLLIFLPNFIWQVKHDFISLEFLRHIHARDVRLGRTRNFLPEQLFACVNLITIPLVALGLHYYFLRPEGRRCRLLGWMYLMVMAMFILADARSYYAAPLYPALLAAGSMRWERWTSSLSRPRQLAIRGLSWGAIAAGGVVAAAIALPMGGVNSRPWNIALKVHDNFAEEIGWPELAQNVARIYGTLPSEERAHAGILAGNYGEAGVIDLYGPALGLPPVISGVNSFWLRSYVEPGPQTVVVVGFSRPFLEKNFERCDLAGQNTNPFGVMNEEMRDHPNLFVCRNLQRPWPEFWKSLRTFG